MRLLHLEDDPDILEITRMALEMSGDFEIRQCSTGDDAVRIAEEFTPEVLLLDVMLPGQTGPEVLARLREIPEMARVPALFMTARAQESEVTSLMENGASGVITKPFDPVTLGQDIRARIRTKLSLVS
jgi:DNA-binding response OmpR family regulator